MHVICTYLHMDALTMLTSSSSFVMLHAKAMICVIAYDMYIECSEGNLDSAWKVKKKLSFWEFRDKLGRQLLVYDPRLGHYPGNEKMQYYTAMNKDQQMKKSISPKKKRSRAATASDIDNTPSADGGKRKSTSSNKVDYKDESSDNKDSSGDVSEYPEHIGSTTSDKITASQLMQTKKRDI